MALIHARRMRPVMRMPMYVMRLPNARSTLIATMAFSATVMRSALVEYVFLVLIPVRAKNAMRRQTSVVRVKAIGTNGMTTFLIVQPGGLAAAYGLLQCTLILRIYPETGKL